MLQIRVNPQKLLAAAFSKALDKIAGDVLPTLFSSKSYLEIEQNRSRKLLFVTAL